jgi:HEAT repeat protein
VAVPTSESPPERIRHAAAVHGAAAVARRCGPVLLGEPVVDEEFYLYLGGRHAQMRIDGLAPQDKDYWFRVWAARSLLYVWDPSVSSAVVLALSDDAWRVREMAAKVCLKRELGEAGDALAVLLDDPVPRVRAAACRALGAVGEAEYAPALRALRDDPDSDVRTRAAQALERLSHRLDRPLDADASS